jgi:hypothetical protein
MSKKAAFERPYPPGSRTPPSKNSRYLTDFRGTLELARDFGLEKTGNCGSLRPASR